METKERATMTRKEISGYLNLSLPTIVRLENRAEDPLPCIKVGKKFLYPVRLVDEWIDREARRQTGLGRA